MFAKTSPDLREPPPHLLIPTLRPSIPFLKSLLVNTKQISGSIIGEWGQDRLMGMVSL